MPDLDVTVPSSLADCLRMVSQRLSYKRLLERRVVDGRDVGKLLMVANSRFGLPVATEETWSCSVQSKVENGVNYLQNLAINFPY